MKYIFSEYEPNYKTYEFPYQVYILREFEDDIEELYRVGALPTRIDSRLYYVARNIRVRLSEFTPSSENRRVLRKNDDLELEVVSLPQFTYDHAVGKLAKEFYSQKFGAGTLSAQKAKWLFTSGAFSHVLIYSKGSDKKVLGYCVANLTGEIIHYAYPFYNLNLINSNFGMGMMVTAIMYAKENNLKYAYLGTCYDQSSKYKLQFSGIEYFNGWEWSRDIGGLKTLMENSHTSHLLATPGKRTELIQKLLDQQ